MNKAFWIGLMEGFAKGFGWSLGIAVAIGLLHFLGVLSLGPKP
jgi:hypothetical protein